MVHNTSGSSQDNVTELSGWQQVSSPLFDIGNLNVESWRDNTTLVQSTVQLNDDLTRSVVIDVFKFTNVTFIEFVSTKKENKMLVNHIIRIFNRSHTLISLFTNMRDYPSIDELRTHIPIA